MVPALSPNSELACSFQKQLLDAPLPEVDERKATAPKKLHLTFAKIRFPVPRGKSKMRKKMRKQIEGTGEC